MPGLRGGVHQGNLEAARRRPHHPQMQERAHVEASVVDDDPEARLKGEGDG